MPNYEATSRPARVRDGITLILAAQPDASIDAQHDVIYCGTPEGMTPEQCAALDALGWLVMEESWGFFT